MIECLILLIVASYLAINVAALVHVRRSRADARRRHVEVTRAVHAPYVGPQGPVR